MPDSWLEVSLHPEGSAKSNQSKLSMVFLGPKANAEFVPKFHIALHASHGALPMVTLTFHPNVALPMLNKL
jgi:hypothetical protein